MGKNGGKGMKEPRPYQSEQDLLAMQEVLVMGRRANNGTYYIHPGDLELWLYYPPLGGDIWKDIYLWDDPQATGKLLGWALLSVDWVGFDVYIQPGLRGRPEWAEMYQWADDKAGRIAQSKGKKTVSVLWIRHDDKVLADYFYSRGYHLTKGMVHLTRKLDHKITNHRVSSNYVVRSCYGEPEVQARATTQHTVFGSRAPLEAYLERYRNFMRSPAYEAQLDIVAAATDGRIGAFCTVWADQANRVGLFEPVGTHPDFQRHGLGTAVMLEGLRRLQERGMQQAIVSTYEDNLSAISFYESLGFKIEFKLGTFEKDV
jgi:mycothiol synthase